jgi:hypothetical protein
MVVVVLIAETYIAQSTKQTQLTITSQNERFNSSILASSSSVILVGTGGEYPVLVADGAVALPVEEKLLDGEMGLGISVEGLVVEESLQLVVELLLVGSGRRVRDGVEVELGDEGEDEDEVVLMGGEEVLAPVDNNEDCGEIELVSEVEVVFENDGMPEPVYDNEDSVEPGTVGEAEVVFVKDGNVPELVETSEDSVGMKLVEEIEVVFVKGGKVPEPVDINEDPAEMELVSEAEVVFIKDEVPEPDDNDDSAELEFAGKGGIVAEKDEVIEPCEMPGSCEDDSFVGIEVPFEVPPG